MGMPLGLISEESARAKDISFLLSFLSMLNVQSILLAPHLLSMLNPVMSVRTFICFGQMKLLGCRK